MISTYLIIGAGPSGLAMARALQEAGIPYMHVEADKEPGGNWFHGVYDTVFTDACKDVMQFPGFPMPEEYPDFLSRKDMLNYLNNFADHFDLRKNIRFNTKAIGIEPIQDNLWKVYFQGGQTEIFRGIIICNGHHWQRDYPALNGNFSGEFIHSKDYHGPEQLRDKRVLTIGSGNSAADIACEAARVGRYSVMSFRDSPWIFPKSFMGVPLGRIKLRNAPVFLDPILIRLLIKITFGNHKYYGLDQPRHRPFEKHPTVSEELPYYLKHGRITTKPGINRVDGEKVHFEDRSVMDFDIIVAATGFTLSFPFLPVSLARVDGKNLRCIGHCVYPDYRGLFFLGWQQVRGGIGSLAGAFAHVIVDLIKVEEEFDIPSGMVLENMKEGISTTNLYGAKEIFSWIKKHPLTRLRRSARKLAKSHSHHNQPETMYFPPDADNMAVY